MTNLEFILAINGASSLIIAAIVAIAAAIWANQLRLAKNRSDIWPVAVLLCPPLILILLALPSLALDHPRGQAAINARWG